ncbi:MAG TPA: SAM-dependent methyltransferase [Opitutaceae bacterium]|nr:SAM-dependent methyltransferase [Opitutaceae bacterium]
MEKSAPSPKHLSAKAERLQALGILLERLLAGINGITLEIGSGHGHFLTAYAATHRSEVCVGIDIILDRLARSERKRTRAGLTNLHFVRAEASEFMEVLPKHVALEKIFILFPDPWPKRRHHKNRLMQTAFLTALAARSRSSAKLFFRTDHVDYFTAATAALRSHPHWEIDESASWPFELATVFQERAETHHSCIARLRNR